MPFDSNGTFNRVIPGGWKADAAAGIKIRADRHDNEDDGFATGLSTCITKDGRTQPTADIPMNNKKLTSLGEPDNPSDGATKNYVDTFKSFTTGAVISGAGPINGFLNFTSPVGINGIGWTTADMSWIGRVAETGKYTKRLAINDAKDGTGNDVFHIDDEGTLTSNGYYVHNATWDGTGWRTPVVGVSSVMYHEDGWFGLNVSKAASTTPYQIADVREYFAVQHLDGSTSLSMDGAAGSGKYIYTEAKLDGKLRWSVYYGDGTPETGANVGSNFGIYRYNDAGGGEALALAINRANGIVTAPGDLVSYGQVISGQNFVSTAVSGNCVVAGNGAGAVFLRPGGADNGVVQATLSAADGLFRLSHGVEVGTSAAGGSRLGIGFQGRNGSGGGYTANWHNFLFSSPYVYALVDNTNMGAIQMVCDHRVKRNAKPLPSVWDKVKALNPISYQPKAYGELFKDGDEVLWGFVAHELQEKLTESAANGRKDEENVIQSPNMMVVVAALTKALQEAMERIEALEAGHVMVDPFADQKS